ncbi:MAG: PAS domain-containing protein [Bacteroidales bacterium]|nr:PAS domain-containing protein [Bacteroidales bacterium]
MESSSANNLNLKKLKKAESKIEYLLRQQNLLAGISQLLNRPENLEQLLDDVLRLIGEHTNVSRVFLFEDICNAATRNTHKWCNAGIGPHTEDPQSLFYEKIPSWKKILTDEGRIFSNNIEDLPRDLYLVLKAQGVKSILVYPLYVQDAYSGFIGLHECVTGKVLKDDVSDLLKTVSNIISNALEREKFLDKLRDNELILNLAIESANEGLWDWNILTDYFYFSDTCCKILGYEPGELEPNISGLEKIIHPDDLPAIKGILTKLMKGESDSYETKYRVKSKDGKWRWILDHGMVVRIDVNKHPLRAIGTHIDITNRIETEQQLQESIDTKDKLFSIIAHDLRGPVGSFLPALDILTGDQELDEESRKEFLEDLKKSARTTFDLLENLLNWARSQTNTISMNPAQFIVNNVINENVELLSPVANQKSINISVKIKKELSAFADINHITLVIRNLLSNAIKFTHDNGAIEISAYDNDRQIEVKISDNGVGMRKEVAENLFKLKLIKTTPGTGGEKGSGLGLLLCKDFVEKNGGQIHAESILGKGSIFIFTIPKAE